MANPYNIKTTLRLNSDILKSLNESKAVALPHKGGQTHHVFFCIKPKNMDAAMHDLLHTYPDSFTMVHNSASPLYPTWDTVKKIEFAEWVIFGTSMSTLTSEMLQHLYVLDGFLGTISLKEYIKVDRCEFLVLCPETNEYRVQSDLLNEARDAAVATSVHEVLNKEIFRSWVEKLDLYYEYSDSLSVYKAGKKREEDTVQKGMAELGLTFAECKAIVGEVYKSQSA